MVAKGTCPIAAKREARAVAVVAERAATKLGDALAAYAKAFETNGASVTEMAARLRRHVPALLGRPLTAISTQDVLMAIAPLQAKLPKTAARVRAALGTCFDYAIARGMHDGGNPASQTVFKFLLPPPPASVPHRMMLVDAIPAFFARLGETVSPNRLCLKFLVLTAARSQEAIRVEWCDIDMDQRLWTVPACKIKMGRVHRVPLSSQALDVLATAQNMFGADRFVFPGATKGSPMSPRVLESLMHQQLREPYSVHGFRAAFSTFAHDHTEFAHELIEMALAHVEGRGNAVARAYNRSDALERRRALMEVWGRFCAGEGVASNVVAFRSTGG
jgi:integrase